MIILPSETLPQELELSCDEVHVWTAMLDQTDAQDDGIIRTLSGDELARAGRFHFDADRRRFVARRSILRRLLGQYLGIRAEDVEFRYGENGKPETGSGEIRFSLSHSCGMTLLAFVRNHPIGVDIEQVREIPEMDQIAERYFSDREKFLYSSAPLSARAGFFYRCWTRKEALAKATGEGLSMLSGKQDRVPGPDWFVHELDTPAECAAALAVRCGSLGIRSFSWPQNAAHYLAAGERD